MSEVSYSNVPPMMAAIKSGDIEAIRSLLHAGHSPNEPQCYQVMMEIGRGMTKPFRWNWLYWKIGWTWYSS